jgi:hypothetical protein
MEVEEIISYIKTLIPEEEIKETDKYYILPTICHNEDYSHASHKLYLYKNPDSTPLFTCYTDCGETFNIYTFVQKYWGLRGKNLNYKEAFKKFHGYDYKTNFVIDTKEIIYNEKFINPLEVRLTEYNMEVLDMFQTRYTDPWALEGIDLEILKKFRIGYSKSYEGVIIPHFDWRGRFIGLRIRTYNPEKAQYAKYMPAQIGNILYRHPLSLNFFGLFNNQNNIKKAQTAILAESEKAVLQWDTMSDEPNITLGVCGSNISKWQMDMLVYFLGVKQVFIAFDKEYQTYTEAFHYVEKIKKQVGFLLNFADVFVLMDENNKFKLKESPFDRTLADFKSLKPWRLEQ